MKRIYIILLAILLIALFFRTYQLVERFEFAHDGDLYSWIVKDIVVNNHYRLIGQLTTAPGIFIGPLFYYLLIPFFLLTKMDPVGALIPATLIGLFTVLSYYLVLSKLFTKEAGLVGAFLYAVLLTTVESDRWVVPTITTSLWSIWYFYIVIILSRGKFSYLPLLGVLAGFIWHIHIALLPTLLAIPAAIFMAGKLPDKKEGLKFLVSFFITSLPLIIFEIRHGFSQTRSLIENFSLSYGGEVGIPKLISILSMITKNINALFLSPQSLDNWMRPLFVILILSSTLILLRKKILSRKEVIPLSFWIIGITTFFTFSPSLISEYYFYNVSVIFITLVSLTFYLILKSSKIGHVVITALLIFVALKNLYFYTYQYIYHKGYIEKKALVNYIVEDAQKRSLDCFGISYITTPGENVGFRYFFWLKKAHLVHPSLEVPVYNIVIPDELALGKVNIKFGHIGLILPDKIPPKEVLEKSCQTPDVNLTDPMFGYVD